MLACIGGSRPVGGCLLLVAAAAAASELACSVGLGGEPVLVHPSHASLARCVSELREC